MCTLLTQDCFLCVYDLQKRLRDKLFILIDVEPLVAFKGHLIKSQKEKKRKKKVWNIN